MVVTNVCLKHVRVHPGHPYPGCGGQVFEPAGGGVAVHSGAEGVTQDRPVSAGVDGAVDRPGHRGWQRDEYDLAALAVDSQDTVAVFLAQVVDVGSAGFEDP
jgi:hypothetical protein